MKLKIIYFYILLSLHFVALGQTDIEYVDSSPFQLTKKLTTGLSNNEKKIRSIYLWITNNIDYDVQFNRNTYQNQQDFIVNVMSNRRGVCQHYAQLFDTLCKLSNIDSKIIYGYTKNKEGKILEDSHAWNAVYLNHKYYLIDATWGSGFIVDGQFERKINDDYYLITPKKFIKDHMPFDPVFQFVTNPITQKEFFYSDFSKLTKTGNFNYKDTLQLMSKLKNFEYAINTFNRIKRYGVTNQMTKDYLNTLLDNYYGDIYNHAVKLYNKGVNIYNKYIQKKNKQFKNADEEIIKTFIYSAQKHVEESSFIIQQLEESEDVKKELKLSIKNNQLNLKKVRKAIIDEIEFVKTYYSKNKVTRQLMFYKRQ